MVSAKQLKNGVSYIELMNENIKLLKKALKFKGQRDISQGDADSDGT